MLPIQLPTLATCSSCNCVRYSKLSRWQHDALHRVYTVFVALLLHLHGRSSCRMLCAQRNCLRHNLTRTRTGLLTRMVKMTYLHRRLAAVATMCVKANFRNGSMMPCTVYIRIFFYAHFLRQVSARSQCSCKLQYPARARPKSALAGGWKPVQPAIARLARPRAQPARRQQRRLCQEGARATSWRGPAALLRQ